MTAETAGVTGGFGSTPLLRVRRHHIAAARSGQDAGRVRLERPEVRWQEMIAYGLFLGLIALIVVLAILRRGEGSADEPEGMDDGDDDKA